ncbi:type II toxin-antitoxin system Phd/YefM family antitoxin [Rugamonas sp. DEMB1]|uniref:type II toxin-antitoxin system Phd/YefM family antitoxin n=1 Tax=Rugamonas sp. DEMB1 TaxID=3039386 RepID=UPI002448A021|nr:type II toxin-antitoxin system Phd/YefM family antitoxin [Rugamonas sp. DEMB1]WGG52803.1 type II toxin-antitoxin system Phd/YefM family antitoxin [Rugamonas sp. DEMB1]
MHIIDLADEKNDLRAVIEQVLKDVDVTVIKLQDASGAVVMSLEYFNRLMETAYLLSSPANAAQLEKSIAQARAGGAKQRDLIEVSDAE